MTREEALEFIGQSVKSDVDMAKIVDAIESLSAEPCEDAISRQNEINCNYTDEEIAKSFISDVEAVKDLLPRAESEPCEDAISRQAVMDAMYDLCGEESLKDNPWRDNPHIDSITDAIEHLPPVTPKQKMGRWIKEKKHHKDDFQEFDYWNVWCSECGARKRIGWTNIRHCPMCGAKMAESEDTE